MKLDEVPIATGEEAEDDDDYSTEEDLTESLELLGQCMAFFGVIIKSGSRKLSKGEVKKMKVLDKEITEFLDQYET